MPFDKLTIYTDGASKGNPGPAAIGVIITDERSGLVDFISQAIGNTTNNQAEYKAVIAGLKKALSLGAKSVQVKSDSELVVNHLNGSYRVRKAELRPLYEEVKKLATSFKSFEVSYIPREQNEAADRLANLALKGTSAQ